MREQMDERLKVRQHEAWGCWERHCPWWLRNVSFMILYPSAKRSNVTTALEGRCDILKTSP